MASSTASAAMAAPSAFQWVSVLRYTSLSPAAAASSGPTRSIHWASMSAQASRSSGRLPSSARMA